MNDRLKALGVWIQTRGIEFTQRELSTTYPSMSCFAAALLHYPGLARRRSRAHAVEPPQELGMPLPHTGQLVSGVGMHRLIRTGVLPVYGGTIYSPIHNLGRLARAC
jgi:hypothetical protein